MFTLKGAFFLTQKDGDIGFPAFSRANDNAIYTCSMSKNLEIIRFYPIFNTEGFHFIDRTEEGVKFSVGDVFPYMFFRQASKISTSDLNDVNGLEKTIKDTKTHPFITLQISRYLSSLDRKYQKNMTNAVTVATELFDLDDDSRLSYISSEISLASKGTGDLYGHKLDDMSSTTIDDMIKSFFGISEYDASRILRESRISYTSHWACLFIYYESMWGMDEFLYIIGKEYLGRLLLGQPVSPGLSARIARLIIRTYSTRMTFLDDTDRDVIEIFEDIADDKILYELCNAAPDLIELILEVIYLDLEGLDRARALVDFLGKNFYDLAPSAGISLVELVKLQVTRLTTLEILDLASWIARSMDFDLQIEGVTSASRTELVEAFHRTIDAHFWTTI